ncbi:hypothetical protein ACLOJK_017337 [Asimina triloba]
MSTELSIREDPAALAENRGCDFPAIFNFGDSNSDTGGLSSAFGALPPPFGLTFFGKPAGRYSDGRLIIDFIGEIEISVHWRIIESKFRGHVHLPEKDRLLSGSIDLISTGFTAYLNSVGTNFTHGVNFATSASTIRQQNNTIFNGGYSPFSLDVQSWQFDQFITRSQEASKTSGVFKSLLPKEEYFSQALYTFDIGQNDITAGLFAGLDIEQTKAAFPDILYKFSQVVKNVYWQGGRYFWIHNTGPLGCLPYIMNRLLIRAPQVDSLGCATPFNEIAEYFNVKLKATVEQLRKELPSAAFTYVDVYSVKYDLIHNANKYDLLCIQGVTLSPMRVKVRTSRTMAAALFVAHPKSHFGNIVRKRLGFEKPLIACCGYGGKYNYNRQVSCGYNIVVNGTQFPIGNSCRNLSDRVNWDGIHYTEAANKFVFDRIVNGAFSDPPIPVRMACQNKA